MMSTETQTYMVRMIIGNDTATSVTSVESTTPENAALMAQMMFRDTTVKIVNVELDGECDIDTCDNSDHWCATCDTHIDNGECANCF